MRVPFLYERDLACRQPGGSFVPPCRLASGQGSMAMGIAFLYGRGVAHGQPGGPLAPLQSPMSAQGGWSAA